MYYEDKFLKYIFIRTYNILAHQMRHPLVYIKLKTFDF